MKATRWVLVWAALLLAPVLARTGEMTIPDLDDSHLAIPWNDFKEILKLIQPKEAVEPEEEPPTPPVEYTLTSAHYSGKRDQDSAAFDFTITLTVLVDKKWVMVPVLPAELAVEELKLDGGEALVTDQNGWRQIMLLGPGAHTVTGRFFKHFGNETGPAGVSVPLPMTPVTTLEFTVAEPGLEIKAEPANINRMSYPEGASALTAVLPSTNQVTLSWSKKVDSEKAALRVNAEVVSLVSLGERLCQVESVVRYEILHRGVTGFKLALPASAAVVDVRGTGLADWKVDKLGDAQEVSVSLNYEAKGRYDLTVVYEMSLETATAEVTVPVLEVKDVSREIGNIGVTALTNIEVTETKRENLAVLDVSQLPDSLAYRSGTPLLYGYKYTGHPWSLTLQVTRHEDVPVPTMMISQARLHTFITPEGKAVTRAIYAMFNNREQFIRLELPEGARIMSAARSDRPVKPARDGKLILLPLEKAVGTSGQALSFTVEITYLLELGQLQKGRGELILEAPKTNVIANAVEWRVYMPTDYSYEVDEDISTLHIAPASLAVDKSGKRDIKLRLESGKGGSSELDGWVVTMNRDNDVVLNERAVQSEDKINLGPVYTHGDQGLKKDEAPSGMVLPVIFEVPERGVRVDFEKSLAGAGEANSIQIKYKKKLELPAGTGRIALTAGVVFAVCFLVWVLLRIRRRRLAAAGLVVLMATVLFVSASARAQDTTKLPVLDDGQVIMKWGDFEKILKELMKPPPEEEKVEPPVPPTEYSFRGASFAIEIKDKAAAVNADYAVSVLVDKKWVAVPLGGSNSGLSEALVDGAPGLLYHDGSQVSLLLLGAGERRVQASYHAAAAVNPGPNSFSLQLAYLPGAMISLTAPAELTDLAISGAVVTGREEADKTQTVRAVAGPINYLTVSYTVPAPESQEGPKEKVPAKIYSQLDLLVTISDEVVSAAANFSYDIKHSPVSGFTVEVPAGWEVVNVTGAGVTDRWRLAEGRLDVPVNYEVKGPYNMTVYLERKREEASGQVELPGPRTVGAERESGFVAVQTRDTLEVSIGSVEGLGFIDSSELPEGLRRQARYPILYSFRFSKHPFAGALAVVRHEDVEVLTATIDTVNLVTLFTSDGKSVSRVIYEIRNNKKQYVKIVLAGLTDGATDQRTQVWSAYLDGEAVKPTINKDGQLLIPLKKSGAEGGKVSFTVELIYESPAPKFDKRGKVSTVFPRADIPASEMLVTLYLPDKYKYDDFEGDLEEEEEVSIFDYSADKPQAPAEETAGKRKRSSDRALNRQMEMEKELADEIQTMNQAPSPTPSRPEGYSSTGEERPTGMLPVQFNVPLRGLSFRFSKLLVMDEAPTLTFNYKKTGKPFPWKTTLIIAGIVIAVVMMVLIFIVVIQFIRWLGARVRNAKSFSPPPLSGPGMG